MAKFAIVKFGTKQYNLEEGKTYELPRIKEVEKSLKLDEVLFVGDDKTTKVGKPFVEKATVTLKIEGEVLGAKVQSRIFKAKSRYRRTRGIRPKLTKVLVEKISY